MIDNYDEYVERERRNQAYAAARAVSREVLDRTEHIAFEPHDPLREDALERWKRQQPKPAPVAPAAATPVPSSRDIELMRAGEWQTYIDSRIEAVLKSQEWRSDAHNEAIGTALGQIREQLRKEFAEGLAALRADLTVASAHSNSVFDLPKFLQVRDAA